MLKKILIALAVVVVALAAFVATRPAEFSLQRTTTIAAPPATVFALVNDYKARKAWYPWEALDPNQTRTYSEPSAGKGAWYEWKGNADVGSGRQEMVESVEPSRIKERLMFKEPFEANNDVTFTFTEDGEGTKVAWIMSGHNNFMAKAMGLFVDMDAMVGPDFERGLTSLQKEAEKAWDEKQKAAAAEQDAKDAAMMADDVAVEAANAAEEGNDE